jgi:hypothetical protein
MVFASPQITGFGVFFVLFQATIVAGLAGLQILGLQRAAKAPPSRSL